MTGLSNRIWSRAGGLGVAAVVASLFLSSPAMATTLDCPLRDASYSIRTPLIDILLNPKARDVAETAVPGLFAGLPPSMLATTAPTMSAILTPRELIGLKRLPSGTDIRLDAALATVPVSMADRAARCARYDDDRLTSIPSGRRPKLLVFEKIAGFIDRPSVEAARSMLRRLAADRGWTLVFTDRGGAMRRETLAQFDAVIWNNVSGDVLTLTQRASFRNYIENGGGFVGIHGSGGDPFYAWDWYADTLIGARFIGHPNAPQLQPASIRIDDARNPLTKGMSNEWSMSDEWYSFAASPRATGARVLLTLDENSYAPSHSGHSIAMGDHPIAWTRCVGRGRSFYSAIGHAPKAYEDAQHQQLLTNAIEWAAGKATPPCNP